MNEEQLEEELSRPAPPDVDAMRALQGDILVLGVAGKMGPSLARLARRASDEAGARRRVIGVARFSDRVVRAALEQHGVETMACDVLDRAALDALPDAPNVVYMVGQKFGTSGDEARTWAVNAVAPAYAAERFKSSTIVAFSTGNVYPLWPTGSAGPTEDDATGPVGAYAQSALARERVLEFFSARHGTRVAVLRLNYAVEPRYGVLRDLADRIAAGQAVDLAMPAVNVIWQRDANSVALRCFARAASPPFVLNLTGVPAMAVRDLAARLGQQLGRAPVFTGRESDSALLSNAARCAQLFGPPSMPLDGMIERVTDWVKAGGRALNKPTHFEEREGKF